MNVKMPVTVSKLASALFGNPGLMGDRWVFIATMDEISQPAMVADGRRANVAFTPAELATLLGKVTSGIVDERDFITLRNACRVLRRIDEMRQP